MSRDEPSFRWRTAARAAAAIVLGALIVAAASSPAHAAAPRPRRRSEPVAAVVQLRVVSLPAPAGPAAPAGRALHPSLTGPPLADRVATFVSQRRALFETAAGGGPRPTDRPLMLVRDVDGDVLLRRRLAEAFRPELARAGHDAPAVLDALEAATSWRSWNHLQVDLGRSSERAARAMELLVRGVLGGSLLLEDRS